MLKSIIMNEKLHLRLNRLLDVKSDRDGHRYHIRDIASKKFPEFAEDTIRKWFRGENEPSLDSVKKLAEYFGVSIDYLVVGEDQKKPGISEPEAPYGLDVKNCIEKLRQLDPDKARELMETFILLLDAAIAKRGQKKGSGDNTSAVG